MKNILPIILFCVFPFITVLIFEGLSPFTYAIGFLTLGALFSIHLQVNAKANNTNKDDILDFDRDEHTSLNEHKVKL